MPIFKAPNIKISFIFCLLILFASIYIWGVLKEQKKIADTDILIHSGSSSFVIATRLEQNKIIHSALYFRWLARFTGDATQLKPGFYHFEGKFNMFEVLDILKKGHLQQFKVTIPEGLRTDEMLILLAQRTNTPIQRWQDALQKITSNLAFEGLFLPETYHYTKPIEPQHILKQMFDARAKVEAILSNEMGWSEKQIANNRIMASIIEKETAQAHERVWVSAAIHNRLDKHMPLQMDPTVIYGIYRTTGTFSGNIRRKDLKKDTPWNTYTRRGLPLTPICNPGEDSLRAAAYPADVDYLYFVADGTGGHAFAATLKEHNNNVQHWIKVERNRNK